MKKIKFSDIGYQLKHTLSRFPIACLYSILFFIVGILLIENQNVFGETKILPIALMVLGLGFILSIASRIFVGEFKPRLWLKLNDLYIFILMIIYFLCLYQKKEISSFDTIRYAAFCFIGILLLCVAAFRSTKSSITFWQFNVQIILRLFLAIAFASVFFGGLALALKAIDILFEVSIRDNWYGWLALFCYSVFAPYYFMSGIPETNKIHDPISSKHPLLKIIGQYVLMPILTIYLIILYTYGLKILITWTLPNGWLTWLIFAYSLIGYFIFLILHNLYIDKETKISVLFGKYFFFSELPLLLLLFLAIFRRTADYGITENRYFIWLVAFWLTGITIYMILTKGKSLRPIFFSLVIVALFAVVGPLNASRISNYSQSHRLEKLLEKNDLLIDGKMTQDTSKNVDANQYEQIKEIVKYFNNKHQLNFIQPLFVSDLDSISFKEDYSLDIPATILSNIKPENVVESVYPYFSISQNHPEKFIDIKGYSFLFNCKYHFQSSEEYGTKKDICSIEIQKDGKAIIFAYDKVSDTIDLKKLAQEITTSVDFTNNNYQSLASENLTIVEKNYKIIFKEIKSRNANNEIENFEASVLITP